MGQPFASAQYAIGNCDRCGFQYKLTELRSEVVDLHVTGFLVCSECWDPDQPQLQLGRWPVSDPQALRNPRPLGSAGGREISYAYRTDFETGLDSWEPVNGTLTWNSSSQTATLVSDPDSSSPGDPWIQRGWDDDDAKIDYLSIDASEYRYVRALFKVNRFPDFEPEDRYPYDLQGDLFWSGATAETVATNNRNDGVTNVYVTAGAGVQFTTGNTIDIVLDNGDTFSPTLDTITPTAPYDIFYLSEGFPGSGIVMTAGNAVTQSFPLVNPPFPFTADKRVTASPLPVLFNSPIGTWYKLTWDVGSVAAWTGTVTTLRLDFFDARNIAGSGEPDFDAGEVEIAYIAVEKF